MTKAEEIKSQAVRLMAEKGFDAVSLRQLAEAAGLQPGSIYTHYRSKAHLLREVYCDYMEDLIAAWQERKLRRQSARQQLLAFVAAHIAFVWSRPEESCVVRLDVRSLDGQGRASVDDLKRFYDAELELILRRGMREGVFQVADFQAARIAVLCLLQGFAAAETDGVSEAQATVACIGSVLRIVGAVPDVGEVSRSAEVCCSSVRVVAQQG